MEEWQIEEQKIVLIYLTERYRPFSVDNPQQAEAERQDFFALIYAAMGTKKTVPKGTKANLAALFRSIQTNQKPEWLSRDGNYAHLFDLVLQVYGPGGCNATLKPTKLPDEWIYEKNILLERACERQKEYRYKRSRWSKRESLPTDQISSSSRGNSLAPEDFARLCQKRKIEPSGTETASNRDELLQQSAWRQFRGEIASPTREEPVQQRQELLAQEVFGPLPPRQDVVGRVFARPDVPGPRHEHQEPVAACQETLATVLATSELRDEIRSLSVFLKDSPEVLTRLTRLEELAAKSEAEKKEESQKTHQKIDNLEQKLDRMSHAIDLLTAGLIGRAQPPPQVLYQQPYEAPASHYPPRNHVPQPQAPPIQSQRLSFNLKTEDEGDIQMLN